MENKIQLKKREIFRVWIDDENGNPKLDAKGQKVYLEFDLEDITLPDRYNKCIYLTKKAFKDFENEIIIINKKKDFKKKGSLMSNNEAEKIKALQKCYKTVEESMDLFLGENGTNKIFGEARYLTMMDDLVEMLKPILPQLQVNAESIEKKIKEKYSKKDSAVLKDE